MPFGHYWLSSNKDYYHMATNIRILAAMAAILLCTASCRQQKVARQPSAEAPTATETENSGANADDSRPVISFSMSDMDGNQVSVSDVFVKNKLTVIDFWASWCGPCRQEMPHLVDLYKRYKGKGLGVIGVSLDEDRSAWIKAVKYLGMDWVQLSDLQGWDNSAARMYGIESIPFTIIVDEKGRVVDAGLRGEDLARLVASQLD